MIKIEQLPLTLWADKYNVSLGALTDYYESLTAHIRMVVAEGKKIGIARNISNHDYTKFTEIEYPAYADHFYGRKLTDDPLFEKASVSHKKINPHHPEYWYNGMRVPMYMGRTYIQEMIADWIAANKRYGNGDLQSWINENYKSFAFHPSSRYTLENLLKENGYDLPA